MTLDELTKEMFEASQKAWREHGDASPEIERAAVLAVLQAVKRECVPVEAQECDSGATDGFNSCIATVLWNLDSLMQEVPR